MGREEEVNCIALSCQSLTKRFNKQYSTFTINDLILTQWRQDFEILRLCTPHTINTLLTDTFSGLVDSFLARLHVGSL